MQLPGCVEGEENVKNKNAFIHYFVSIKVNRGCVVANECYAVQPSGGVTENKVYSHVVVCLLTCRALICQMRVVKRSCNFVAKVWLTD